MREPSPDGKVEELPEAVFATGYMGDENDWCYWDAEYPEEGACGPFSSREEAVRHAVEAGYQRDPHA